MRCFLVDGRCNSDRVVAGCCCSFAGINDDIFCESVPDFASSKNCGDKMVKAVVDGEGLTHRGRGPLLLVLSSESADISSFVNCKCLNRPQEDAVLIIAAPHGSVFIQKDGNNNKLLFHWNGSSFCSSSVSSTKARTKK